MEPTKNLSDFSSSNTQSSGGSTGLSLANFLDEPKANTGPVDLAGAITQEGAEHIKPLIEAFYKQESGSGKNAGTSVDGAKGGMQVIPATFSRYAKPGESIDNPADNVRVGVRILKDLASKFGNDPAKIATGYFSGDGNVNQGSGQAWKEDRADGNGMRVSKYVSGILDKLGVTPKAQTSAAPDIAKAPKWSDIEGKPEFKALNDEQKAAAKQSYFDYWIAPHAGAKGDELRKQFMQTSAPERGMLDGVLAAAKSGVGSVIDALTPDTQSLESPYKGERPSNPDATLVPVSKETRAGFNSTWDAATPEQRKAMAEQPGWVGQLARERNSMYAQPGTQIGKRFDPRVESRRDTLIANGEDARFADTAARMGAQRGVVPGQEVASMATAKESGFDFDTKQAFQSGQTNGLNNPLVRGLAKGGLGFSKAITGYGEFLADAYGLDEAKKIVQSGSQWARGKEQAIGESGTTLDRNFEGAISSIAQQLPLIVGGIRAGSEAVPLAGMALQSFGQEYSDGRAAGQDVAQATTRAAIFAAFEVIGEKFGLRASMQAIKGAAHGMASDKLLGFLGEALKKEIPGELLTTTGQFATDKFAPGGVGLNPNATLADYLQQVADTVIQTVMQGGVMAGGTTGVSAAVRHLQDNGPTRASAAADADLAQQQAMSKWATTGLGQSTSDPAGRVDPVGVPDSVHPSVTDAEQIVRELAADAGIPEETVLPTKVTPQPAPIVQDIAPMPADTGAETEAVSDQDVINLANSRYQQLREKRDGTMSLDQNSETGDKTVPGAGLSERERAEMAALEASRGDVGALRKFYGIDQQVEDFAEREARLEREAMQADDTPTPIPQNQDDDIPGFDSPANQEVLTNGPQATQAQQAEPPQEVRSQDQDQPVDRGTEARQEPSVSATGSASLEADGLTQKAPKTEKEAKQRKAIDRIAKGSAYFGSQEKATGWISDNGLAETHEAKKTGASRWDVVAKENGSDTRAQAVYEASKAAAKALENGGTDADAMRAATDSLIESMDDAPGISVSQDAPAALEAAKQSKQDAPGTRYATDADRAGADRLEKLLEVFQADRNTPAGQARSDIRSVIEDLRKPKTVVSVEAVLQAAAQKLDRQHGPQADVVREVLEQIDQRKGTDSPGGAQGEQAGGSRPTPAAETSETGVVVIPADAGAFAGMLRDEINGAYGDERLEALFNAGFKKSVLPKTVEGGRAPKAMPFLSAQESASEVDAWKTEAKRQGKERASANADRTVISLFDASGVMSQPWRDAGYNVVTYDLQNGQDISDFSAEMLLDEHGNDKVWAVIAQPPCTDFASSGARWWKEKDEDGRTEASNELVRQTLRTIELLRPAVWLLENPVGRIAEKNNLPDPLLSFDPWHFGDPWTKRTQYWGRFNNQFPTAPVEPTDGSKVHKLSSSNKYERSLTPEGVAYAAFMANNAEGMSPAQRMAYEFAGVDQALFVGAFESGTSEYDVRTQIEDAYHDGDLDAVRETLEDMAGGKQEAQATPAAAPAIAQQQPVDSLYNPGKPDPKNSAAMDELEGFKPGDTVDVDGRTIGRSTVELVYRRQMAGLGAIPMARVVGANGKKLDVLLSELTRTEQKPEAPAQADPVQEKQVSDAASNDFDAMFDDVLAEELAKDNAKKATKPKTEKEAKAKRAAAAVREMTEEGRAKDGKPLNPGDLFRTLSGRTTTPYPKQKGERYASEWLIENTKAEAQARGDDFNTTAFGAVKPLKGGNLTDADRDSMLMYLFGEQPAVVPSILKPLGSAATNTAAALGNAIDGLGALFGGTPGKLQSGMGFDEDTYAKAKPLFQAAVANLGDAGKDLKEAMRTVIRMVLDKFGAQAAQNMKPYVVRFVSDLQSDTINTQQEGTQDAEPRANQEPGEPASQQRGPDRSGSGQANQEGLADPSPADGATTGQPGSDGRPGADSASQDVGSRGPVRKGRNATDGRKGTSGAGVADDGAGKGAAGNPAADHSAGTNYHIADPEQLIGGTPKVRFARNKKGIEAFNAITSEGREPTKDELDAMAGYIGWGSFGQELFQGTYDRPAPKDGWAKESEWLREHLGKEAWQSAQASIINAHYTDPVTVAAMWDMVRQLGFTGGRTLEPSMGVGNFFGLMPRDLMERSKLAGIEMETTTGGMAQLLYPDANIQIKPYQDSKTADDFYDLVIGNWPFAKDGPVDRRYLKLSPSLHDYFFLKALDQTRPGGLVVGITSAGTMDKVGTLTRAALAEKADLVAAFRLPSGAFEKYAGTKVVTDIIILKKRETPNKSVRESGWLEVKEVPTPSGTPVRINQYFAANPGHILGTLDYGHGTTSMRPGMIVNRPADLEARLNALAKTLPAGVFAPRTTKAKTIQYVTNNTKDREQSMVEKDGELYQVHGEYLAPLADVVNYKVKDEKKTAARVDQIKRLVVMRRAYGALIDAERDGLDDTTAKRTALKKAYDSFVADHGTVNDSDGLAILKRVGDPFYPTLAALEDKGKPSAIMTRQTVRAKKRMDKPSVRDALVMVRNESIDLNMGRVAELAGVPVEKAAKDLTEAGAVYMTPAGNYEVGDVYLSGNVRRKLREAEAAAEQGMDMKANIEALREIQPKDIPYYNIEAKFGATWIRPEQYREFIARLLGVPASDEIEVRWAVNRWKVKFNEATLNRRPEATTTWGHPGIKFDRLLSAAMGNVSVRITYKDADGNTVVDEAQTAEANEKAGKVREEFSTWLWSDPARRIEMERTYNEAMNAIALPKFDGSFLSFEGMALQRGDNPFSLRKHQIDAIWRGLANGRSINAHEVGTGKTYTMGGLAIESRRYGIAKKPIIFAHNANSASVAREIGEMYPGAKLLYIDNLAPDRIAVTLRQIANDDWDAIVVPHSLIDRFALKRETLMEISREQINALEMEAIDAAQEDGANLSVQDMDDEKAMKKVRSSTAKQLVHARNAILKKIEEQAAKSSREDSVSFEDMGIDMVIVDEAHEFKKPPIATRMRMKGLNTATSSQSISMNFLTSYVKKINNGRGVHLFTGTPITNTMTEIFNVMRYVMDDQMARDGLQDWDAWFNTFADSTNDVELTASGEYEPITRLAAFVNTAELRRMIGQYMDIVFADDMPEFKPRPTTTGKTLTDTLTDKERDELLNGRNESPVGRPYKRVVTDTAEMTAAQKTILATLQERSNIFKRASKKDRKEMMMSGSPNSPVIVETDASNAGLDARLFDISANDEPTSKVNRAVTRLVHHYNEHPLATQVVFVERGFTSESVSRKKDKETGQVTVTKKARFNLIEELIDKLVAQGIKRDEIAVVDGSTSKEKRKLIADAMNRAEIRVVIGNTKTLGVGVNMQANLRAMHHLDAPWMPGDLEQRNGRGHRQGNKWNTVMEYRYLTERIDGRRWQVLAVKDRFIKAFLKADEAVRVIDGDAVSMDEEGDLGSTLADAAGDPRLLMMNKLRADVGKLEGKERMHSQAIYDAGQMAKQLERDIKTEGQQAERAQRDNEFFREQVKAGIKLEINGQVITEAEPANEALARAVQMKLTEPSRDSVELGTAWGFTIEAYWPTKFSDVQYSVTRSGGLEYPIGKATIESVRATLYGIKERIAKYEARIAEKTTSLPRMVEATKAPFARADELAKKRKMFSDIEADIQLNPIPAPAWLRNGAPTNTAVFVDGKPAVVEGHRWTPDGYMVTLTEGDTTKDVDYLEVKDVNGLPIYEVHPFTSPVVTSADGTKTAQGEQKAKPGDAKFNQQDSQGGYTGAHETGQPDNTPDTQAAIQALERRFAADFGNAHPVQGWSTPSIEAVLPIADAFGTRIVGFKVDGKAGTQGVIGKIRDSNGFFFAGSVFLNASTDRPHLAVLGHETAHRLKKTRPDLYAKLVNAIRPYVKGKEYGSTFATSAVAKDSYPAGATVQERDAAIQEEFVGEVLSDGFMDPAFWQALGKANKELLARVQLFVAKIINKVLSATGYKKRTEQYLSDYAKVMEIAGQVMAEYGLNQGNLNKAAGLPKFEVADKATEASADTPDIRFNTQDDPAQQGLVRRIQNNLIHFFGNQNLDTFNWYDKSIATQYHKALKDPHFGKVYQLLLGMQNHVSMASVRAAQMAPGVLPRVDDAKTAVKELFSVKSREALDKASMAIFSGTLAGESVLDGVVWSPAQLRSNFQMDETAIALYYQARAAIDSSLDEVAAAEAYSMAHKIVPKSLRADIIERPEDASKLISDEINAQIKTMGVAIAAAKKAGDNQTQAELSATRDSYKSTLRQIEAIFTKALNLKNAGYAPLMRFGKYTVEVQPVDPQTGLVERDEDGKPMTIYFGRFETQADARRVQADMDEHYKNRDDIRVSAGSYNDSKHEIYSGVTPETLELFADAIGAGTAADEYIRLVKSDRSALKRQLERKGTPGFSTDVSRVLSNFITSNARHAAQQFYMQAINNAVKYIPKEKGDVQKEAQKLRNFVIDPKDAGAIGSSLMFAWFLGGSPAAAAVNATQPLMVTLPYLSQFVSPEKAAAELTKATPAAMGKAEIADADLRDALRRASLEGAVDAQEIFHLYSLGSRQLALGTKSQAALTLWGSMFSAVEGLNRRLTFIAAWNIAKQQGNKSPYAFAIRAVNSTQGIYNKVNRPNFARHSVGRLVFTYKGYAFMVMELMTRMWKSGPNGKRGVAIMLAMLLLASGEEGLPGAKALDDIIDTIGQWMGYDTNMRRFKRRHAYEILGKAWGDFLLYGASSQLPLDFGGRLGLGSMIPGTELLKTSSTNQRGKAFGEIVGPSAGMAQQVGNAVEAAAEGNYGQAAQNLAPKAVRDVAAGLSMVRKGYATDAVGRKVVDVGLSDAAVKAVGFQPTVIAQEHRKTMPIQQDIALQQDTEASIVANWAQGIVNKDENMVDQARAKMEKWNKDNPDSAIAISPSQIKSRVKMLVSDKENRTLHKAPKEMRGRVGLDLADD